MKPDIAIKERNDNRSVRAQLYLSMASVDIYYLNYLFAL